MPVCTVNFISRNSTLKLTPVPEMLLNKFTKQLKKVQDAAVIYSESK
jgi:hypothetical protein